MAGGEYTEKLNSGGELCITAKSWSIKYYFAGPDRRYNGTFVTIPGSEIDKYIDAWKNNFNKYTELKQMIPSGGSFDAAAEMGMHIHIGFSEGVCLRTYHMPIRTTEKLNQVLSDYTFAKVRAQQIQSLLQSL